MVNLKMNKIILLLCLITQISACKTIQQMNTSNNITSHAMRLNPGDDVREKLENYVLQNNIKAGWLVTCAGSLIAYNIRFANQEKGNTGQGHFEIVSLTGTLSKNGSHIHISISDSTGKTIGGHLLNGCLVYTTAEIILQSTNDLNFKREKDGTTPWEELQIEKLK